MKIGKIKISRFNVGLNVFTPDFYLNEGKMIISDLIDKGVEYKFLYDVSDKLYQGGIFKRVFVNSPEKAHLYITATDMVKNQPIANAKYISKKYTPWVEEMTLRNKQILVSCAGTVGNTALVNDSFEECIGSQEIIRIETSKIPYGYLYAYLSTPLVNQYIQSMIYGAVIPRISPSEIGKLPVLLLPEAEQQIIHDLIVEAADLRVEANELLRGAHKIILEEVNIKPKVISNKVSVNALLNTHLKRFEAQCFISEGYDIKEQIKKQNFKYLKDVTEPIFRPGIFKRHYVENGVEFLGGSNIVQAIPRSDKKLSISKTKHLNELLVKEDWILITCGGTIGYSVLVDRFLENKAASQHILRVIANGIKTGYLFAFLSSPIGLKAIQSFTYGSVIPQIEPHHLDRLPIPILEDRIVDSIHNMIMTYKDNIASAIEKELKAISLIEQTIDSWQTS